MMRTFLSVKPGEHLPRPSEVAEPAVAYLEEHRYHYALKGGVWVGIDADKVNEYFAYYELKSSEPEITDEQVQAFLAKNLPPENAVEGQYWICPYTRVRYVRKSDGWHDASQTPEQKLEEAMTKLIRTRTAYEIALIDYNKALKEVTGD